MQMLSVKVSFSPHQSVYIPTLTYDHEVWVVSKTIKLRHKQHKYLSGLSLEEWVRCSVSTGLRVELVEKAAIYMRCFVNVLLRGKPGLEPGCTGYWMFCWLAWEHLPLERCRAGSWDQGGLGISG